MLSRLVVFFRSNHEYITSRIRRVIGQCKRYRKAGVKALEAARKFLSVPSDTNVFEPLTPVLLELDQSYRYESELLNALKHDQVRNIAVTGEYGAGKSSVIRTFIDRHPELTSTYVSLAAFGKDLDKDALNKTASTDSHEHKSNGADTASTRAGKVSPNPTSFDEKTTERKNDSDILTRIEETIVQQLLYAVPSGQLPKTRLKRIIQTSLPIICFRTAFFSLLFVSFLRLYVPTIEKQPKIDPAWLLEWLLGFPGGVAVFVVLAGLLYFLYSGLKLLSLFSIDGLTIKGGKLETAHHGSVLHKNVDEIIYCFERSNIDIVVIEDLDRFGIHDVFTRLREINFIIKQSPQIKRPVYFIYALRDELFAVGEKTKFFDLIIPVIPVVNSENSREKMVQLLNDRKFDGAELGVGLDPVLIETVCYYIDDMRLIKNIVNEYDMFSSILGSGSSSGLKLDPNKLFAIVTIRNLYPAAYADLVKRRGPIYEVIHGFSNWRVQQSKRADDQFQELRERREERVLEIAADVVELRAYVWYALLKASGVGAASHILTSGNNVVTLDEFVKDEVFDGIFNQSGTLRMVTVNQYGQHIRPSPTAIGTKELLASTSYEKRHELLQFSTGKIDSEMAAQRKESGRINHLTFRAAAKKGYVEVITETLKDLDVVSYLMRSGYFDTDYTDYFGYFYEGSLTAEDKNLILGLRRGVAPDVGTVVSSPKKVVEKLDTDDLGDGRGIIVGLIEHLCTGPYDGTSINHERSLLMTILRSGVEGHLDRMAEAFEILTSAACSSQFIQAVYTLEPGLFHEMLNNADRFESVVSRQAFFCAVMDGLEVAQARQLDSLSHAQIYDAVAGIEDVSRLIPGLESNEKGWAWMRERPTLFSNLGNAVLMDDLKSLIKWECIELNQHMLSLICQKTEAAQEFNADLDAVGLVSYRRLKALDIDGLDDLLFKLPEEFADVLLSQVGMLDESNDSLSRLLWAISEDIESDLMDQLFDRTTCMFGQLEDLPQSLWAKMLLSDRVSTKHEAVWTFFGNILIPAVSEKGCEQLDMEAFAVFIQRHAPQLRTNLWETNISMHQELEKYLLALSGLGNETLEELFAEIVLDDLVILEGTLSKERWEMLARSTFLAYSTEIHKRVKDTSADLEAPYLIAHWAQAREHLDISQLPIGMVMALSKSRAPDLDEKMKMWAGLPIEAFEISTEAVEEVARICGLANRRLSSFPPSFVLVLRKLATREGLAADQRTELLIQCLPTSNWEETALLLSLLPDDGITRLSPSVKKIEVSYSDLNARLINALKLRGFVQTVVSKDKTITATSKPSEMK